MFWNFISQNIWFAYFLLVVFTQNLWMQDNLMFLNRYQNNLKRFRLELAPASRDRKARYQKPMDEIEADSSLLQFMPFYSPAFTPPPCFASLPIWMHTTSGFRSSVSSWLCVVENTVCVCVCLPESQTSFLLYQKSVAFQQGFSLSYYAVTKAKPVTNASFTHSFVRPAKTRNKHKAC